MPHSRHSSPRSRLPLEGGLPSASKTSPYFVRQLQNVAPLIPVVAAQFHDRDRHPVLLQHTDDLLFAEPTSAHRRGDLPQGRMSSTRSSAAVVCNGNSRTEWKRF